MVKTGDANGAQMGSICIKELAGHEYAVRKVQWSNFSPDVIASASYDMTGRMQVIAFVLDLLCSTILADGLLAPRLECPV